MTHFVCKRDSVGKILFNKWLDGYMAKEFVLGEKNESSQASFASTPLLS